MTDQTKGLTVKGPVTEVHPFKKGHLMNHRTDPLPKSSRRSFLKTTAAGTAFSAAVLAGMPRSVLAAGEKPAVVFSPLPYAENSLEPYISAKTLHIHHDKHYRKYVEQVLARIKGGKYAGASLEKIVKGTSDGINMEEALHLMAVMAWNHDFYWKSMKPKGGGPLPKRLDKMVTDAFGSVDAFKKQFKEAAMQFGSGWTWLALDKGKPVVMRTKYHESPLVTGQQPLLTIDTWEHAYYLDYQDRKEAYVDAFINHLANWSFAESQLPEVKNKK